MKNKILIRGIAEKQFEKCMEIIKNLVTNVMKITSDIRIQDAGR